MSCNHTHALKGLTSTERPTHVVRFGTYFRVSDRSIITRFRCSLCKKTFSEASFSRCYQQKKRHMNIVVFKDLCSGVSQRRIAYEKGLNRKTVARKLRFLGLEAKSLLQKTLNLYPRVQKMSFDDLETIEHTKLRPLSVTLAVDEESRRILGIEVASMAAKGLLASRSRKKYGRIRDERSKKRISLFNNIKDFLVEDCRITSDENPYYTKDVRRLFPRAKHITYEGQRGSLGGQGELKKIKHDPLFVLNHTCAMLRANINRLFRKTWCTTKNKIMLEHHLNIYALYHNERAIYQNQKVK